jgi:hypothetical protein
MKAKKKSPGRVKLGFPSANEPPIALCLKEITHLVKVSMPSNPKNKIFSCIIGILKAIKRKNNLYDNPLFFHVFT